MSKFKNHLLLKLVSLVAFIPVFQIRSAQASILNGSFETDFNPNWSIIGDVQQIGVFNSGPTDGDFQAILTTASANIADDAPQPTGTFNFSGNSATSISNLESFLELTPGTLTPDNAFFGPFEGSAIKQTFSADSGETLRFDWNFLTNDTTSEPFPGFVDADYTFLTLQSSTTTEIVTLANTDSPLVSSSTIFAQETGFNNYSMFIDKSGDYTLSLGVIDLGGTANTSALLIDNVELINSSTPEAVPEPSQLWGIILTISLLSCFKKNNQ